MRISCAWAMLCALPLSAVACSSDEPAAGSQGPPPPSGEPWRPTTKAFDPTCASCVEIGAGQLAHGGASRILVDRQTDDPPAQWGGCVMSLLHCLDREDDIPACVTRSTCPAVCKAAFAEERAKATGEDPDALAVDRVFFDQGARCAPPAAGQVSP